MRPRSPLIVVLPGCLIYLLWHYGQPVLLALSTNYVASGIIVRVGGSIRRRLRHHSPQPEHQAG